MLRRLNRELAADFHLERFAHRAFFNAEASRVEMHLVSPERQIARVAGERIAFDGGIPPMTLAPCNVPAGRRLSSHVPVHEAFHDPREP